MNAFSFFLALLVVANPVAYATRLAIAADAVPNEVGVLPVGTDGKPLNLDFETGTLKDWTAEGDAFKGQPIKGDVVFARRNDNRSRHQGQYWIGGFEKVGDKPTGTLTSVPFKATHRWATFLVGGGPHEKETCVEIVTGKDVIFRASGLEEEDMRRVLVDLGPYQGKDIFIRIVDKHTGHWGHINFDDFRFHAMKPTIAERPKAQAAPMPDTYKFAGLKPEEAAKAMTVPEGFSVSVFAGEPDVHQPIAMCTDDRGRLWVVEGYVYPKRNPHPGPVIPAKAENPSPTPPRSGEGLLTPPSLPGKGAGGLGSSRFGDKILIFEDTDGDGKFDKKTVFFEGLNMVSGIELGFGGIWIGAAPYLIFIPHDLATDKAGSPKFSSTAGATRTRTKRSTRSSGARTAGSTVATASSRIAASASPAPRTRTARPLTPVSGATTRPSTCSKSSLTAPRTRGVWITTPRASSSSRRA